MKKRLLSSLLILVMLSTMMFTSCAMEGGAKFSDMPNDWSTNALENAIENGLLSGSNGKIMPKDNLSRAQMASILNRAFGSNKKASLGNYTDVPEGKWYYVEMEKAVEMGTFKGSGDGKLNPEKDITREEAFIVLANAFKLPATSGMVLDKFSDNALISTWAKEGVASLVDAGYVAGSNGKLSPKNNITRAEFAQIIDNILKNYIKVAGVYTKDYNGNVMINVPGVKLKDIIIKGDLIIGDGIKEGEVTLEGVVVTGRTIIRGGSPIVTKNEPINYVALGDSIAYGMSATNNLGYVNLLYDNMKVNIGNEKMMLFNLGIPGDKSSDLLDKLKNDSATIEEMSKAKVITISIGGNNILSPVINTLAMALNIDPTSQNFDSELEIGLADPNLQRKLLPHIGGLQSSLAAGVKQFANEWVEIIEIIEHIAPEAEVYVMTLYNPIDASDQLYRMFDPVIQGINGIINTPNTGYTVVDVNKAFQEYQGLDSLVNFSLFTGEMDPHPTNKGHEVIYQSHISILD